MGAYLDDDKGSGGSAYVYERGVGGVYSGRQADRL